MSTAIKFLGSMVGIRGGYETPVYTVLDKIHINKPVPQQLEIRKYEPRFAIEATVPKTSKNGRAPQDSAFRILGGYIFGNNKSKSTQNSQSVPMTVPVEMKSSSTKIAMTVPVETNSDEDEDTMTMRFFLGKDWNMENVPTPNDDRVKFVEMPSEIFAVITFSGNMRSQQESKEEELLDIFAQNEDELEWKIEKGATPSVLGYDPPSTLPFLKRNEAIIKVIKKKINT